MIMIILFLSLFDYDENMVLGESFNELKIEVEYKKEKILKTNFEKDHLFIISHSNDTYYLNINNKYHLGKYILKKNGIAFFKVELNKLTYLAYIMKLISPAMLRKLVSLKYDLKLLIYDFYRVYKGRKSRFEILKTVKAKMKNEKLMILMKENYRSKYKYYYWIIDAIFIVPYGINISYDGNINYLEVDASTGKIAN